MARAIWSGSISFGLVNIPVKLYNAVSRKSVSFNQIDRRTGARIRYRKVSAADEAEVSNEDIVKGYELPSGEYVLIDDDELAALDPEAVRTIDIEEFVDLADIDPIYYDAAYYLAPDKATTKPYALLAEAMERSQKVGIARFVMRSKQYLAAVRPKDGKLLLSTMVYPDEVNDADGINELDGLDGVDVSDRELGMAEQLIASLSGPFEPEKFEDTYRNQVLGLIERKAAGETELVAAPQPVAADKVVDLMAALEASVSAAKEARKRHPTGRPADDKPADGEAEEAAKPVRAGKVAARKAAPRKRKSA
ncbi:MAG TPA: Ku protein [Acidimicrobiales bacterium]|jgi:DNA end-binding protein Ku|nr:Ku protein [Acidimicrobiales bacterium]